MPRKKELPYQTEGDTFATRLREVMTERGENQTTLAAKITEQYFTIQRQSISQYMQGQSKPDTLRLTAICQALDVSSDYLLGLIDVETPDFDLRKACEYTGLSKETLTNLRIYCVAVDNLSDKIIGSKGFGGFMEAFYRLQKTNTSIEKAVNRGWGYIRSGNKKKIDSFSLDGRKLERDQKIALYELWESLYSLAKEVLPNTETVISELRRCNDALFDARFEGFEDEE